MPPYPSMNSSAASRYEMVDPFAMQLALSRVHARLVPMRRAEGGGYELDSSASAWFELPSGRGFAGYGLGRALRMLLDVLRGLTALHDTFTATGNAFAHGEVALPQFRVDNEGVCRLVPLTPRHFSGAAYAPEALGHVAPERLLGEGVDARSDVFSAGVLLWEALAGRRLFSEASGDAIIDRLMGEKLQMPQLPPELAWAIPLKAIAARALSVDPYQRFADCAELSTAITIVARERVASHSEIASFFGSTSRSGSSITPAVSLRPVPSQSSTFSVDNTQRTHQSTLAPLGVSRSFTPAPGSVRSFTPALGSMQALALPKPFAALLAPPDEEEAEGEEARTMLMLREELAEEGPASTELWTEPGVSPLPTPIETVPEFRPRSRGLWVSLAVAALVAVAAVSGFLLAKSTVHDPSAPSFAGSPEAASNESLSTPRHDRPGTPLHELAPPSDSDPKPMPDAVVPRGSATGGSKPRLPERTKGANRDYGI